MSTNYIFMHLCPEPFHAVKMCSAAPVGVRTESPRAASGRDAFLVLFCTKLLIVYSILFPAMVVCKLMLFVEDTGQGHFCFIRDPCR